MGYVLAPSSNQMVLLSFDDKVKEGIEYLFGAGDEVFHEFCKISVRFLTSGGNRRAFGGAAQALNVTVAQVEASVEAIAYVFLECSRHRLSELDFHDTLALLGVPASKLDLWKSLYVASLSAIRDCVREDAFVHYRDLAWRLDVLVEQRTSANPPPDPTFTLQLELQRRNSDGSNSLDATHVFSATPAQLVDLSTQVSNALRQLKSQQYSRIQRNVK